MKVNVRSRYLEIVEKKNRKILPADTGYLYEIISSKRRVIDREMWLYIMWSHAKPLNQVFVLDDRDQMLLHRK